MNSTMTSSPTSSFEWPITAFIGGGNMSSALLGGLLGAAVDGARLLVVEPLAPQRQRLQQRFPALQVLAEAGPALRAAQAVVWAVKPQQFAQAAAQVRPHLTDALHVSIMAGVRCGAIARQTGAQRLVRTMPNTPALIGQGITGLFASAHASAQDRAVADALLAPAGRRVWVEREDLLDAVTAVSGSGPAYAFYLAEAMTRAGEELGLSAAQARELTLATLAGAAALAQDSSEPLATLRANVTSKGGTTAAALEVFDQADMQGIIDRALHAAARRARELGDALDAV
ncbi:pyrroline-5-carboxylate reductase [Thiomonas sp.]|uniref:pyrroline-5-carboxylate reductase n=1 Tax=Thiomonas sp. TaxID=2047785 RepID=UPI00260716B7|nr:pyrroline-5-carboxylate reductase [Thiomonas sp.]